MSALNEGRRAQLAVASEVLDLADHMGIEVAQVTLTLTEVQFHPRDNTEGERLACAIDAAPVVEHYTTNHLFSTWTAEHRGESVTVFGAFAGEAVPA